MNRPRGEREKANGKESCGKRQTLQMNQFSVFFSFLRLVLSNRKIEVVRKHKHTTELVCVCAKCKLKKINFEIRKCWVFMRCAFHYKAYWSVWHIPVNNISSNDSGRSRTNQRSAEKWFLALQLGLHSNYFLELVFFVAKLSLLLLLLLCVCCGYIFSARKMGTSERGKPLHKIIEWYAPYVIR